MTEQWQELKKTIIELRDNDGTGTQQEICKFLANLMDILEKQMQEPKTGHWIENDEDYYKAINEYGGGVNENTDYFVDDIACSNCLSKFSVIDNET